MNRFNWKLTERGVELTLSSVAKKFFRETSSTIPISQWSAGDDATLRRGLTALSPLFQDMTDSDLADESLKVPHDFVSKLSEAQAKALSIPPSLPFQLRITSSGRLNEGNYILRGEFLDGNTEVFTDPSIGAILPHGRKQYRLPYPIFQIIEELNRFEVDGSRDSKLESVARILSLMGQDSSSGIEPERALADMRIRQASAFSVSIHGDLEDPELKPVLFAEHLVEQANQSGDLLSETQQILGQQQSSDFSAQFLSSTSNPSCYLLQTGEYVYIDPALRESMRAFRKVAAGPKTTRKAFISSPRAVLGEFMNDPEGAAAILEQNFVETSEFSDRVLGVGRWTPADLPFYVTEANDWGTDIVILRQEGSASPISITKEGLGGALEAIQEALASGSSTCQIEGQTVSVSESLRAQIASLLPERPDDLVNPEPAPEPDSEPDVPQGPFVVITRSSFEELNYSLELKPAELQLEYTSPRALKPSTTLLEHQKHGLKWLVDCHNVGLPGVIMADDMGLGKTLQALSFLALYREKLRQTSTPPILIVAPTGLLNNWQKEIDEHLLEGGLGSVLKVYGSELKSLKTGRGRDTDSGVPMLDVSRLRSADIVLTTYETARDYQQSFSQVRFGVTVFDEIQKAKNPKSLINKGVTALFSDFKIGLSGTPVENTIADLWVLMDVVAEGLIKKSLKDFIADYSGSLEDHRTHLKLLQLHEELLEGADGLPPPILRRMKDEVFKEAGPDGKPMPKKKVYPAKAHSEIMPAEQADLYNHQANLVSAGKIPKIQALGAFRRISLSPREGWEWLENPADFASASGRLSSAFKILDEINRRKEKVIIFLEKRDLQAPLAQILKERYSLSHHPLIINGAISGGARQERVNKFQKGAEGFDAIIISPKAGGVGLTLTEANHVLHLERWWNPAVEDQCNDRAYRIGQKKDVEIYTPIAVHPELGDRSFDVVLDDILTRKRLLASTLLVPTELDPDEIYGGMFGDDKKSTKRFIERNANELYELETGEDFERYVATLLHHHGFEVRPTPRSWDKGCDLIAKIGARKILIQCKQVRSDAVLSRGVSEIVAASDYYSDWSAKALVTNAKNLTRSQLQEAKDRGVQVYTLSSLLNCGDGLNKGLKA